MKLAANIEHLRAAPGVVAVMIDEPTTYRGPDTWSPICAAGLQLLALTGEATLRVSVGQHAMVVQRERDHAVAVVIPAGHAVAKSLRRLIRRLAARERGAPRPPARAPLAADAAA